MRNGEWDGVERRRGSPEAKPALGARQAALAGAFVGALGAGPLGVAPGALAGLAARWAAKPAAKALGSFAGAASGWARAASAPMRSAGSWEGPRASDEAASEAERSEREVGERWERGREALNAAAAALARDGSARPGS